MNNTRQKILNNIRTALGRDELSALQKEEIAQHIQAHERHLLPAHAKLDSAGLLALFIAQAKHADMNISTIDSWETIPSMVANLIQQNQLGLKIRLPPDPRLINLNWQQYPTLRVQAGAAVAEDEVSITACLCAVAETSTLVIASGPNNPSSLNFLPPTHMVVLPAESIVAHYEDAWDLIRGQPLSRCVHFISGPSRTGDVEQTIQIGIHGPKKLYVLLVQ